MPKTDFKNENFLKAARTNDRELAETLLESKADPNYAHKNGTTVLMWASENGNINLVKKLLEKKANVNAVGMGGMTALHIAAYMGRIDVVEKLLEEKADINYVDGKKETALMDAAHAGHSEIIGKLLEKNADITKANKDNKKAFDIAKKQGHLKLADMLKMYEIYVYKGGIMTFNFGLDNKSDKVGTNDQGEQMKNNLRPLRLFSEKLDHEIIREHLDPFLKPKFDLLAKENDELSQFPTIKSRSSR
jgi:ankyrin repeat protein